MASDDAGLIAVEPDRVPEGGADAPGAAKESARPEGEANTVASFVLVPSVAPAGSWAIVVPADMNRRHGVEFLLQRQSGSTWTDSHHLTLAFPDHLGQGPFATPVGWDHDPDLTEVAGGGVVYLPHLLTPGAYRICDASRTMAGECGFIEITEWPWQYYATIDDGGTDAEGFDLVPMDVRPGTWVVVVPRRQFQLLNQSFYLDVRREGGWENLYLLTMLSWSYRPHTLVNPASGTYWSELMGGHGGALLMPSDLGAGEYRICEVASPGPGHLDPEIQSCVEVVVRAAED